MPPPEFPVPLSPPMSDRSVIVTAPFASMLKMRLAPRPSIVIPAGAFVPFERP